MIDRTSDAAALAALKAPGTRSAVRAAFRELTLDGSSASRDPVDAVKDAEHALAAVRAWAAGVR